MAPGLALRTAHYAVWGAKHGMLCVEPGCHFFQRRDLEGAPLRAATKDVRTAQLIYHRIGIKKLCQMNELKIETSNSLQSFKYLQCATGRLVDNT